MLVGTVGKAEVPGVYGESSLHLWGKHDDDDGEDGDTVLQTSLWAWLPHERSSFLSERRSQPGGGQGLPPWVCLDFTPQKIKYQALRRCQEN